MATIKNTSVNIKGNNGETTPGTLVTTHYDHSECVKRALMKLGLFWILALASIPIVFAHWVLVPGFFIAGPWMAYRTFQMSYVHNHVQGQCPDCQKAMEIKMDAREKLPKWSYCPHCNAPLQFFETETN